MHILTPRRDVDLSFRMVFQQILEPRARLPSFGQFQLVVPILVKPLQHGEQNLGLIQVRGTQR
jgi:hypothetical protein